MQNNTIRDDAELLLDFANQKRFPLSYVNQTGTRMVLELVLDGRHSLYIGSCEDGRPNGEGVLFFDAQEYPDFTNYETWNVQIQDGIQNKGMYKGIFTDTPTCPLVLNGKAQYRNADYDMVARFRTAENGSILVDNSVPIYYKWRFGDEFYGTVHRTTKMKERCRPWRGRKKYVSGEVYTGTLDEEGRPHTQKGEVGTLKFANSNREYKGSFSNGKPRNKGTMTLRKLEEYTLLGCTFRTVDVEMIGVFDTLYRLNGKQCRLAVKRAKGEGGNDNRLLLATVRGGFRSGCPHGPINTNFSVLWRQSYQGNCQNGSFHGKGVWCLWRRNKMMVVRDGWWEAGKFIVGTFTRNKISITGRFKGSVPTTKDPIPIGPFYKQVNGKKEFYFPIKSKAGAKYSCYRPIKGDKFYHKQWNQRIVKNMNRVIQECKGKTT